MHQDQHRNRADLQELIDGYQVSQAVSVAARLGIADLLIDGPKASRELARATGAQPESLLRLLRALASRGIFIEEAGVRFGLTPLAEGLRTDLPDTLHARAIQAGQPHMWDAYARLDHSIMTGESAFQNAHGMGAWAYRERHPAAGETFDNAMRESAGEVAGSVVAALDVRGAGTVVDVGGGNGALLVAILVAHPHLRGILFDQAQVVSRASELIASARVGSRCSIVPGDFFDSVPAGGDIYILKGIIHDWDDTRAAKILRNCRRVVGSGGRLLLIEQVLAPDGAANPFTAFMDLHMLVIHGARERTREQFTVLLESAGFRVTRVLPTDSGLFVIEAVPQQDNPFEAPGTASQCGNA